VEEKKEEEKKKKEKEEEEQEKKDHLRELGLRGVMEVVEGDKLLSLRHLLLLLLLFLERETQIERVICLCSRFLSPFLSSLSMYGPFSNRLIGHSVHETGSPCIETPVAPPSAPVSPIVDCYQI